MSATERIRAQLDERGVEWKAWDGTHPITVWHDETYLYEFIEYRLINGAKQVSNCPSDNDGHCELTIKVFNCTPAQAIAATLGETPTPPPPTMPEQPPYDLLIDLLRDDWDIDVSWDGLRRFWYVGLTDEGVRKRDEREATLGAGMCKAIQTGGSSWMCSECGCEWRYRDSDGEPFMDVGGGARTPRFCPWCGRRIEQ